MVLVLIISGMKKILDNVLFLPIASLLSKDTPR